MTEPDEEPGFSLVMPFVACASQGGPYDDTAFVSGYRLGQIDAQLQYERPLLWEGYVTPGDEPQLDLIAMQRGYAMETAEHDAYWTGVILRRLDG